MNARHWLCLVLATWPLAAAAQLVVRDDALPRAVNPAGTVPYPAGYSNCNNTIADAGARAVVRAIDSCPETFFESRYAYLSYARAAVLGIVIPGAPEAAGALIVDKAKENALFCISGALIDESGASDADKAFMKALVAEAKEIKDRVELAEKLGELRTALKEKGAAGYLDDGEVNTFVKTLDVTLEERYEGLGLEGALASAGRARYDTPETRARNATTQARELARQCRYDEAAGALAQAQQANLAYLAYLRAQVSKSKHLAYCLERNARQQPINALNPPSPFLGHSLASAAADVADAERRDADQTQFIGELADLEQSVRARRNDVDVLKTRAARHLEAARQSASQCDWAGAASALDTLNTETLECALQLDEQRRAREALAGQIAELQRQIGVLDSEYAKIIATPYEAVNSCGELSVAADTINQFQGQCRALVSVDAKIAILRQRARECAEFKTAGLVQNKGTLPAGTVFELVEAKPDNVYAPWTACAPGYVAQAGYGYSGNYGWSAPPQQVGAAGFQLQLRVTCQADKGQRLATGIGVSSGFKIEPQPHVPCNVETGQSNSGSLTVQVTPPQQASPGTMVELRIGAFWGLGVTYKYRAR
jgi:hypothetical protein